MVKYGDALTVWDLKALLKKHKNAIDKDFEQYYENEDDEEDDNEENKEKEYREQDN
jgi:hypothetical protein